ncbi:MAG: hydrogenase nickel incorporation protein HypB [Planctomycetia bacterium]|nr:hydrogenase nickel incorporation protein HypB [Planctomycetia bacterium]
MKILVDKPVLSEQQAHADGLRQTWTNQGTLVVHLVSSPGAGKTSLLEATARHWNGRFRMAVLVGDIATERDAERLLRYAPTQQLTTGGACHLNTTLVEQGWLKLPAQPYDFLFIENVGNLVCPASFDLGEHHRVVLLSVTEGDDKPGKYPKMFRTSQALVLSKCDLLPHVPFSVEAAERDAHRIQPDLTVLTLSAWKNTGIDAWCSYLETQRQRITTSHATCRIS